MILQFRVDIGAQEDITNIANVYVTPKNSQEPSAPDATHTLTLERDILVYDTSLITIVYYEGSINTTPLGTRNITAENGGNLLSELARQLGAGWRDILRRDRGPGNLDASTPVQATDIIDGNRILKVVYPPRVLFVKAPNSTRVSPGQLVGYTFTGFGNGYAISLEDYAITDIPEKGLDFVSATLPAFANGAGVTYNVIYRTNLKGSTVLYSGLPADQAFSFNAPSLQSGEYITAISLVFATVPSGFAQGNTMQFTFRVWNNPPRQRLVNNASLGYRINDEDVGIDSPGKEIIIDGYFPITGDDFNLAGWFSMIGISLMGMAFAFIAYKRKEKKAQRS